MAVKMKTRQGFLPAGPHRVCAVSATSTSVAKQQRRIDLRNMDIECVLLMNERNDSDDGPRRVVSDGMQSDRRCYLSRVDGDADPLATLAEIAATGGNAA